MKFSVVLVCRNAERYIACALESLVVQQSENVQVQAIVVDGASTDGTFEIVKSFEGRLDELIATSEPDTGIYNAMNKGLAKATGDVVSILNSDDWLFPGTMAEAAEELANEGIDYVYGTAEQWSNGAIRGMVRPLARELWPKEIWWQMPLPHVTLFAKRSVYDRLGGFDESYCIGGDHEWVVRLYVSGIPGKELPDWRAAGLELGGVSEGWARFPELYRCARQYGQPSLRVALRIARFMFHQLAVQILPHGVAHALMRLKHGRFR